VFLRLKCLCIWRRVFTNTKLQRILLKPSDGGNGKFFDVLLKTCTERKKEKGIETERGEEDGNVKERTEEGDLNIKGRRVLKCNGRNGWNCNGEKGI